MMRFTILLALLVATTTSCLAADVPPPTFVDVAYGPHERNVLDVWLAKSDRPTPLVVFIHGGGFVNGDKASIRGKPVVTQCLDAGVSFASLNYRFREHAPIQDILRDAARAIQFIRTKAPEWNIDPAKIASYGGSAGAGTSLWLAFHDDLADPNSPDPVLRQSTRLAAAGSLNGQATYDLREWEPILGKSEFQRPQQEAIGFYGFKSVAEAESPEGDRVMKDCSMLGQITPDDPPVILACAQPGGEITDRSHYLHHPKHSTAVGDRCKAAGVTARVIAQDEDPHDRSEFEKSVVGFLLVEVKR